MFSVAKASVGPVDVWVIFFVFTEFVGGLAIRKIDGGSCLCVFFPCSMNVAAVVTAATSQ